MNVRQYRLHRPVAGLLCTGLLCASSLFAQSAPVPPPPTGAMPPQDSTAPASDPASNPAGPPGEVSMPPLPPPPPTPASTPATKSQRTPPASGGTVPNPPLPHGRAPNAPAAPGTAPMPPAAPSPPTPAGTGSAAGASSPSEPGRNAGAGGGNAVQLQTDQGLVIIRSVVPPAPSGAQPSWDELAHGARSISAEQASSYPLLANDFLHADRNRDGRISKSEFAHWNTR